MGSSHVPVGESQVSAWLEENYGLSGRLRSVATEKDDTFRLATDAGGYLVKVSPPDEPVAVVGLQTAAMRFLEDAAADLPVQRLRLTLDGNDHVLITAGDGSPRVLRVFNFVEGTVWAERNPGADQLAQLGGMLGRVDVALSRFAHPADHRELVWDIRHFRELEELVEHAPTVEDGRSAEAVFRLFEATVVPVLGELESQVIHGDYSPYNVVVDDQREGYVTGVIDFGDTMRSAVIFDPAVAMANLLGRTPDQPWWAACAFAAGYQRTRPIKERELPCCPLPRWRG
jgi:Ser/Thr protein kinase RdoA (MazF antagonist)